MQITENTNIVQSNYLVENRPDLTKDETRLFLTIIGAINKEDADFQLLRIPVKEFACLWGIDSKNAYQQIKDALRGLRSKEFFIEGENPKTGKMRFLSASSVSAAVYEDGEGYATVEISQLFRPYLLELKEKYTMYFLKNVIGLSCVNAIRNYEILKQYERAGRRKILLSDYKRIFHIDEKYSRNIDLKRWVIEPSIEEINNKTDIYVTFEYGGRSKDAFVIFTIKPQKRNEIPASNCFENHEHFTPKYNEELQDFEDIEQFRTALTDPHSLSHEQLDVCVTLARTSTWYLSLPTDWSDDDKIKLLKHYIRQQDKHSRANFKTSFYGYFRKSCQNNWAEVPTPTDQKEESFRSFDTNEFYELALKRSMGEGRAMALLEEIRNKS